MFICLSFVGKLPNYIVDCVHQIRLYTNMNIYIIIDDVQSEYIKTVKNKYENIIIVQYKDVVCQEFIELYTKYKGKFSVVPKLKGREQLFFRAYERLYLLNNLMKTFNLTDCFFMEIDNLIYDDPKKWLPIFQEKGLGYMFDNTNRFASGIMYVKSTICLEHLLNFMNTYVVHTPKKYVDEMTVLSRYFDTHSDLVHVIPTFWDENDTRMDKIASKNFGLYKDSVFDAASVGIYLLGYDPYHTKGVIKKHSENQWSMLKSKNHEFKWETDEKGLLKPYVKHGEKWILLNNLHVHSKNLKEGLSKPFM